MGLPFSLASELGFGVFAELLAGGGKIGQHFIAAETGARYEATLRDDDLPGSPGDRDHSWLGLMRYDYRTMITALGGTAPTLDALDTSDVSPDKADYPQ